MRHRQEVDHFIDERLSVCSRTGETVALGERQVWERAPIGEYGDERITGMQLRGHERDVHRGDLVDEKPLNAGLCHHRRAREDHAMLDQASRRFTDRMDGPDQAGSLHGIERRGCHRDEDEIGQRDAPQGGERCGALRVDDHPVGLSVRDTDDFGDARLIGAHDLEAIDDPPIRPRHEGAIGIGVDENDAPSTLGQRRGQHESERGLARSAFRGGHRDRRHSCVKPPDRRIAIRWSWRVGNASLEAGLSGVQPAPWSRGPR